MESYSKNSIVSFDFWMYRSVLTEIIKTIDADKLENSFNKSFGTKENLLNWDSGEHYSSLTQKFEICDSLFLPKEEVDIAIDAIQRWLETCQHPDTEKKTTFFDVVMFSPTTGLRLVLHALGYSVKNLPESIASLHAYFSHDYLKVFNVRDESLAYSAELKATDFLDLLEIKENQIRTSTELPFEFVLSAPSKSEIH